MKINHLTLSFHGEDHQLEARFLHDYFDKSILIFRIAILIGIIFYGFFGVLDALLMPQIRHQLWFIRYAVVCPILLVTLLLSYSHHFRRYWQPIIAMIMSVSGLGIIAMIILAPPPVNYSYYAGLILVLLFGYTLPRARFIWAAASGWFIVVSYEIAAIHLLDTPVKILINNSFFFISANVIGMIACYFMEFYTRQNFYLLHLLEEEKDKVNHMNSFLQEKNQELEQALDNVRILSGLIPICMHCKKIRDDQGYWNQLESYITTHSEVQFSHGLCPDCMKEHYPEVTRSE